MLVGCVMPDHQPRVICCTPTPLLLGVGRSSIFFLGMKFTGSPIKLKVSQGQPVKLNCSLEGMEDPEMLWIKDGAVVQSVDQVYIPVDEEHWIGFLRYNRCREGRISRKLLHSFLLSAISMQLQCPWRAGSLGLQFSLWQGHN